MITLQRFYQAHSIPQKATAINLAVIVWSQSVDAVSRVARETCIIQLNLDEWKGQLSRTDFRVPGIPIFFEIDEAGKPTGRVITGGAGAEDIPENMAPPLKSFFKGEMDQADGGGWHANIRIDFGDPTLSTHRLRPASKT